MPKVSDDYRAARRGEIADAVLRGMEEVGYSGLSMSAVFEESGLSAGAVYSHFRSKSEIALFVVQRLHDGVLLAFRAWAEARRRDGAVIDPPTVTRWMLTHIAETGGRQVPLLQLWAEATVQGAFRSAMRKNVRALRDEIAAALSDWAAEESLGEAEASARRAARGCLVVASGFISQSAVYGDVDVDRYLDTLRSVIGR